MFNNIRKIFVFKNISNALTDLIIRNLKKNYVNLNVVTNNRTFFLCEIFGSSIFLLLIDDADTDFLDLVNLKKTRHKHKHI
jgi:hypothetical protein